VTRISVIAVSAFAVAYPLATALRLPVLLYDPVAVAVRWSRAVEGMSMRYYGDLLVGCAAAVAAAAIAVRTRPRLPLAVSAAFAGALVALDVVHFLAPLFAAR